MDSSADFRGGGSSVWLEGLQRSTWREGLGDEQNGDTRGMVD